MMDELNFDIIMLRDGIHAIDVLFRNKEGGEKAALFLTKNILIYRLNNLTKEKNRILERKDMVFHFENYYIQICNQMLSRINSIRLRNFDEFWNFYKLVENLPWQRIQDMSRKLDSTKLDLGYRKSLFKICEYVY